MSWEEIFGSRRITSLLRNLSRASLATLLRKPGDVIHGKSTEHRHKRFQRGQGLTEPRVRLSTTSQRGHKRSRRTGSARRRLEQRSIGDCRSRRNSRCTFLTTERTRFTAADIFGAKGHGGRQTDCQRTSWRRRRSQIRFNGLAGLGEKFFYVGGPARLR